MIYTTRFLFLALSVLLISAKAFSLVKLPAIFSDHMVLQQKTEVQFWGWADPEEMVSVRSGWSEQVISVTADASGKWKMSIPTPSAGGPYIIEISGNNNNIRLKDVLVGEVWVCSGQSNMVFSLKSSDNATTEIPIANHPSIRYFSVERQYGNQLFDDCPGSVWKKTSSKTAANYSAIAYYFAKKIHQDVNVPVGIVYAAWGGTPAEAWTPQSVLHVDPKLSVYLKRWQEIQQRVGVDSVAYRRALEEWKKNKGSSDVTTSKRPKEPKALYYFKRPWREPGVLFNGMINPIIPYSIKGVLWYQGESNVAYSDEYYYHDQ